MDDSSSVAQKPKEKIPPICLQNIENYQLLVQIVRKHVKSNFHIELKGSTIKVYSSTTDDFRALTTYFEAIHQQYCTYKYPGDKNFSVIIRNLPCSINNQEITTALQELNYPVNKVTHLLRKNKQPTPLCAVELVDNDQGKSILNLTQKFYSVVKVKPRRHSREIPQRTRCQNFGHIKIIVKHNRDVFIV